MRLSRYCRIRISLQCVYRIPYVNVDRWTTQGTTFQRIQMKDSYIKESVTSKREIRCLCFFGGKDALGSTSLNLQGGSLSWKARRLLCPPVGTCHLPRLVLPPQYPKLHCSPNRRHSFETLSSSRSYNNIIINNRCRIRMSHL